MSTKIYKLHKEKGKNKSEVNGGTNSTGTIIELRKTMKRYWNGR